ncbi:uncharacterized protein C8Q71DRAFT_733211 [Rhodofomes roseus]|uniref:Protein kinase domain-containing protein n=1 Tax=Rhodofomes roseus TaxID=34475 RepID=A0ABQ8KTW2_9APHY|nr:uncharacterized protein C8Q71DRAFT_733211 [Rhodofomes roseus]KAH9842523.1 hypothetical protein C8Q71DRAFT_733211 [Rhodofomes roseus]
MQSPSLVIHTYVKIHYSDTSEDLSSEDYTIECKLSGKEYALRNTIEMIAGGRAVLKKGPWNVIQWEGFVYGHVQRLCGFPVVCEQMLDYGTDSTLAGLILRPVVVFDELVVDHEPELPEPPRFPSSVTAAIGAKLMIRMRHMHFEGILHTDIHPGNIGLPSFREPPELASALHARQIDDLRPTFIDFGLARINGYHPMVDCEYHTPEWTYISDRVVRGQSTYTKADDLESLAYSLFAFRLMSHPPWHAEATGNDFDGVEDRSSDFLATRHRRSSCTTSG